MMIFMPKFANDMYLLCGAPSAKKVDRNAVSRKSYAQKMPADRAILPHHASPQGPAGTLLSSPFIDAYDGTS